jgi:hypothetical protein
MSINNYGLKEIKNELKHLSTTQIADLCLRMAKYKKENKELLAYLLFEADNEAGFIESIKSEISLMYSQLNSNSYQMAKGIRKILRYINKHVKFAGSKRVEVELLSQFCRDYIMHVDRRTNYKSLKDILLRQLTKLRTAISKLHEDLQFDYMHEYEDLILNAHNKLSWVNKSEFLV